MSWILQVVRLLHSNQQPSKKPCALATLSNGTSHKIDILATRLIHFPSSVKGSHSNKQNVNSYQNTSMCAVLRTQCRTCVGFEITVSGSENDKVFHPHGPGNVLAIVVEDRKSRDTHHGALLCAAPLSSAPLCCRRRSIT